MTLGDKARTPYTSLTMYCEIVLDSLPMNFFVHLPKSPHMAWVGLGIHVQTYLSIMSSGGIRFHKTYIQGFKKAPLIPNDAGMGPNTKKGGSESLIFFKLKKRGHGKINVLDCNVIWW